MEVMAEVIAEVMVLTIGSKLWAMAAVRAVTATLLPGE